MPTTAAPTAAVDAATLAGSQAPLDFSLIALFFHADFLGKAVMIMLILASFWCWAIIFEKWVKFRSVKAKADRFEQEFWSSEALDRFHEKIKNRANHPMAMLFTAAMDEWFRSRIRDIGQTNLSTRLSVRERIVQIMQVTRNREVEKLESGLGFLATVGSSAPFIGLFGTVWGIMRSFQSIALSKNTSLAVVAPGIAEALLATAIGLFAAIPAVIAFNKFSRELDKLDRRMEDFSTEFNTLLSRQIDGGGN